MSSSKTIWQVVLGEMEVSISRASFNTWFQNTHPLSLEDNVLTVGVPNIFTKKQMEDKYSDRIAEVLNKHGYSLDKIIYKIHASASVSQNNSNSVMLDSLSPQIKDSQQQSDSSGLGSPIALNPKYTFDSFIVGSSNELAHAACHAVTKQLGTKYNPLFIYGVAGLGKTHLIHAVGNSIKSHRKEAVVVYVTCEQFVKEFLDFIRYKKKGSFGENYRTADVLIIDDIQFIAGKERTEQEFFHTFNTLHQANKQIILSSDQPPKSIPTLEERLRSRFEWGMTVDIQPPDFETRCAILQAKAASHGHTLPEDTVEYLATSIQTNIRELEGSLNQLIAFCELKNSLPTIDIAAALMGNKRAHLKRLTAKQIIERTSRHFQIDLVEIIGPKRDKDIVLPRQIAMYLLRKELHLSYPKIAQELGRKDHTTAMHSVDKIENSMGFDHDVRQHINDIKDRLHA